MKKGTRKKPDIYNDPLLFLSPEEKAELRKILVSPVYVKLMRYVERYKPPANCSLAGSRDRDAFSNDRANARLGEIRGWELHIAGIFSALTDAPILRSTSEPTYPMSGTMNLEPQMPPDNK